MSVEEHNALKLALRRAAAALREANIPYALAGGMACWARGGPPVDHDVDFVVVPQDAERALSALETMGFRTEHPIEQWLYKAWDGPTLVDVIFEMSGRETWPLIERAEVLEVAAIRMPVITADDILLTKLNAVNEQDMAYLSPLRAARALREQIDWEHIRIEAKGSPFAAAFMTLVEELEIAPRHPR